MLKDQIKSEIKKEMKEVKEEIKAEIENKMLLSSNNNMKTNIPNLKLKIPINNNFNAYDNSYDYNIINNNTNPSIDGKNADINSNRSISSIDIFFPPNKNLTSNYNQHIPGLINTPQINNNNKDNFIMKKLVKLYNVINKQENVNKPFSNNNSFNKQINNNNNIYYKIPIMNNSFYCKNKNAQNDFYNNNYYYKKNISIIKKNNNNKIIRIRNNCSIQQHQNLINNKSNSPKRKNISILPFKKIIVKNIKNPPKIEKITYDKIIRIPKKIIKILYKYYYKSKFKIGLKHILKE